MNFHGKCFAEQLKKLTDLSQKVKYASLLIPINCSQVDSAPGPPLTWSLHNSKSPFRSSNYPHPNAVLKTSINGPVWSMCFRLLTWKTWIQSKIFRKKSEIIKLRKKTAQFAFNFESSFKRSDFKQRPSCQMGRRFGKPNCLKGKACSKSVVPQSGMKML